MSPVKTFVDAEEAAKQWARSVAAITAVVGQRVFLAPNNDASFPQLVASRAGGSSDRGEAPLDLALISFSCWAASRRAAGSLAYVVMGEAESMAGPTPMGAAAVGLGATCELGPRYLTSAADEQARRYRYVLDVEFVIRAA